MWQHCSANDKDNGGNTNQVIKERRGGDNTDQLIERVGCNTNYLLKKRAAMIYDMAAH